MSTLGRFSSREDVLASMADNASYFEDSSVQKAKAYLTALNIWQDNFAFDESDMGPSKIRFDQLNRSLPTRIAKVESWINAQPQNDPTKNYAGYSHVDIQCNGRGW